MLALDRLVSLFLTTSLLVACGSETESSSALAGLESEAPAGLDAGSTPDDNGDQVVATPPPLQQRFDIVVVGAGTGGVSAAIQAARLGRTVALLEETDFLGGQMGAAAVSTMDSGRLGVDSGIYKEFANRATQHYQTRGRAVGTCGWSQKNLCFEPLVIRQVLATMLAEQPSITVYKRTRVTAVRRTAQTVTGVFAEQVGGQSREIAAAVVIDATEWGDLLPLAGVPYRVGKVDGPTSDASMCVQDNTYVSVIRKYATGVPAALRFPGPPPGYTQQLRDTFAKTLSPLPECPDPTSSPTPACYDWTRSGVKKYPVNWRTFVGYRGLPDSTNPAWVTAAKPDLISLTSINWGNDIEFFALDIESPQARKKRTCEAKLRTLQFLYYVQSEVATSWSVADTQEFGAAYDAAGECSDIGPQFQSLTRHFPPIPYVRESRRIVGVETLTGANIYRTGTPAVARKRFANAIAVGDYMADLHGCRSSADLQSPETTADFAPGSGYGPFQVPMGALIPATVDGFLAAEKNLSVTRIANGAIRLQPITMMTGQAVGALAALSVANGTAPRAVRAVVVQDALIKAGLRLTPESLFDMEGTDKWNAVQLAAATNVMPGYSDGSFRASSAITRAEAAVMLTRLFQLPLPTPRGTFSDVPLLHAAAAEIEAATGLLSSCGGAAFCPEQPITRAEAAIAFARGMKWSSDAAPRAPFYSDVVPDPSHDVFDSIQLVTTNNVLGRCAQGRFCPNDTLTRGDMASAVAVLLFVRP